MKTPLRKALAIGWLAVAVPVGGVWAFQLYAMATGLYDPVLQDAMAPEKVAGLRAWLAGMTALSIVSSLLAAWYLRHTP